MARVSSLLSASAMITSSLCPAAWLDEAVGALLGLSWRAVHADTTALQKLLPKLPLPLACTGL